MKKNKVNSLIILFSLAFIVIAILVVGGYTKHFDNFVYELITKNMNDFTTSIWRFFTLLGSTKFIVIATTLIALTYIILKQYYHACLLSSTVIISTIVNRTLKIIFRRERPEVLKLVKETSFSFPSGHTMAATTLYGLLIYFLIKSNLPKVVKVICSTILIIIIIGVGLSRVYLGAHFISDVIAGFIVSTILILIVIKLNIKKDLI